MKYCKTNFLPTLSNVSFFSQIASCLVFLLILVNVNPIQAFAQNNTKEETDPILNLERDTLVSLVLKGETIMNLIVEDDLTIPANSFILYENEPNPFHKETVIAFTLFKESDVTFTIYDATGKILKEEKGFFEKGRNQIIIQGNDLEQFGVLYYQMTTPSQILSKKMVYEAQKE